jgi:hypothetical protein
VLRSTAAFTLWRAFSTRPGSLLKTPRTDVESP